MRDVCRKCIPCRKQNQAPAEQLMKETQESICQYCLSNNIEWHFSPERAPNFGGLWEAVVKAAKTHLRKLMGTQKFTYEELATIVTQIEACLNSRPLTPINCAGEDGLDVLTPGSFLIGRPLEAVPDQMDRPQTPSLLKRWNLCQAMAREFWYKGGHLSISDSSTRTISGEGTKETCNK